MNISINKRLQNIHPFILSLCLNTIIMLITFLLWEPTTKSDDYDMSVILYGGLNGEYSTINLYYNALLGKLLVFLLNLFPSISWFFILQYLLMFLANTIIGYLLFSKSHNCLLYFVAYLIFFSYEFYIRITFSKTAGILIVAGYLIILFFIERQISFLYLLYGCLFILAGSLFRNGLFELITFLFFPCFIFYVLKNGFHNYKKILCFIICVLLLFILRNVLYAYSTEQYSKSPLWKNYIENNTLRGNLSDYGVPPYDKYANEYADLGISKNDYTFWFEYSLRGDNAALSNDLYREIITMKNNMSKPSFIAKIRLALIQLPYHLYKETAFWFFLIISIAMFVANQTLFSKTLSLFFFSIIAYFIMTLSGRTQHHIDVVIYTCITIQIIYYYSVLEETTHLVNSKSLAVVFAITPFFLLTFSNQLANSSYYENISTLSEFEKVHTNYKLIKPLSKDKQHFYVITPLDTYSFYECFTVFEPIEKNFYSNIYRTNMCHVELHEQQKSQYGIDNIWAECTDSEIIRFIFTESTISRINVMQQYIQEHYNSNANYELVDKIDGLYIYKVTSASTQAAEDILYSSP